MRLGLFLIWGEISHIISISLSANTWLMTRLWHPNAIYTIDYRNLTDSRQPLHLTELCRTLVCLCVLQCVVCTWLALAVYSDEDNVHRVLMSNTTMSRVLWMSSFNSAFLLPLPAEQLFHDLPRGVRVQRPVTRSLPQKQPRVRQKKSVPRTKEGSAGLDRGCVYRAWNLRETDPILQRPPYGDWYGMRSSNCQQDQVIESDRTGREPFVQQCHVENRLYNPLSCKKEVRHMNHRLGRSPKVWSRSKIKINILI